MLANSANHGHLFLAEGVILDINNNVAKLKWINAFNQKVEYIELPFEYKIFHTKDEAESYMQKIIEEKFNAK